MTTDDQTIGLDDKYTQRNGRVFISGYQALVLLPLLQRELDQRAGSGHRGLYQRVSGITHRPLRRGAVAGPGPSRRASNHLSARRQ